MDSENVALVRRIFELFNALDTDREKRRASSTLRELIDLFAEDVEFVQVGGVPDAGGYGGRRSLDRVWDEWLSIWREHRTTLQTVREDGDRVLALSHERFLPREGMELENDGGAIFTVRDGRVVRFEAFTDQAAAIDAFDTS